MINRKTTAVRIIPAPGKKPGDMVEFGGLLGRAPVMPLNPRSSETLRGARRAHPGAAAGVEQLTKGRRSMSRVETISTEGVAAHRKVRFWNEAVSAAVATASADPLDAQTFSGTMKCLDLGPIRFAEILGGASSVKRGPCSARASYYILGSCSPARSRAGPKERS